MNSTIGPSMPEFCNKNFRVLDLGFTDQGLGFRDYG